MFGFDKIFVYFLFVAAIILVCLSAYVRKYISARIRSCWYYRCSNSRKRYNIIIHSTIVRFDIRATELIFSLNQSEWDNSYNTIIKTYYFPRVYSNWINIYFYFFYKSWIKTFFKSIILLLSSLYQIYESTFLYRILLNYRYSCICYWCR